MTGACVWRIDDLAQRAGVAVDTIRFYQREGLLPAGERVGRTVRYGPGHLERLQRIRALQARRFSLAAIHALLEHDGGLASLEQLLAGPGGAAYDYDALLAESGVSRDLARRLEKVGLLPEPGDVGHAAYDSDDAEALRAFSDLTTLGIPERVLVELARVIEEGIESMQRQIGALFQDEYGPQWGPGIRERFRETSARHSARIVRDLCTIADYVQRRNIQRVVLRALEQQRANADDRADVTP